MRLRLFLRPLEAECRVPINYQYPLSAAIYKILEAASRDYADYLHQAGYRAESGRNMKLFVFSWLDIPNVRREREFLLARNYPCCTLLIASPMLDFMENFVAGLLERQELALGNRQTVARFQIERVEEVGIPDFEMLSDGTTPLLFFSRSPINVSVARPEADRPSLYLDADDPRFPEAVHHNLFQKFTAAYGHYPDDQTFRFRWDEEYIRNHGGYGKISKLVRYKEGHSSCETSVRGFLAPMYLSGSPELLHCAYECGLGEKNSMGFGMIELA